MLATTQVAFTKGGSFPKQTLLRQCAAVASPHLHCQLARVEYECSQCSDNQRPSCPTCMIRIPHIPKDVPGTPKGCLVLVHQRSPAVPRSGMNCTAGSPGFKGAVRRRGSLQHPQPLVNYSTQGQRVPTTHGGTIVCGSGIQGWAG